MLFILIANTIILIFPMLAGVAPVLNGANYSSLIIGTFAIYAGANVAQKKVFGDKNEGNGP